MILRDPVHGLVAFEGGAERVIMRLLATREVQRLRRVRQLGLTSLVFPGAEHSRFAHALGAAHVMIRLLERVRAHEGELPADRRVDATAADDALAAAFLHDLGHGPFSHLFEEVLPHARSHEDWTLEAIRDPGTDVHAALEELSAGMSGRVASLIAGSHPLHWLARAVSGMLDVDRCDYLLRDSHMTGVGYGLYDLEWLLRSLAFAHVGEKGRPAEWVLAIEGRKGLPPIEGFFLARNFMYQQVYHHKATRAAECLVRAIFVRVAELIRAGTPPEPLPEAWRAATLGEPLSLGHYLALDDVRLLGSLADWEDARDPLLGNLSRRLRARVLPKTVPLPEGAAAAPAREEALARASAIATRHGLRADLEVFLDTPSDTPYPEPTGDAPEGLWVVLRHQPVRRLGDISFLLGELRNKPIERPRLIFPLEIRDDVLAAIEDLL